MNNQLELKCAAMKSFAAAATFRFQFFFLSFQWNLFRISRIEKCAAYEVMMGRCSAFDSKNDAETGPNHTNHYHTRIFDR